MNIKLDEKNNPTLNNGKKAFDLRNSNNIISLDKSNSDLLIETPVRFGGGLFECNKIGAFTFFNGNSQIRAVDSIGRFCMIGPDVRMGMPEITLNVFQHI